MRTLCIKYSAIILLGVVAISSCTLQNTHSTASAPSGSTVTTSAASDNLPIGAGIPLNWQVLHIINANPSTGLNLTGGTGELKPADALNMVKLEGWHKIPVMEGVVTRVTGTSKSGLYDTHEGKVSAYSLDGTLQEVPFTTESGLSIQPSYFTPYVSSLLPQATSLGNTRTANFFFAPTKDATGKIVPTMVQIHQFYWNTGMRSDDIIYPAKNAQMLQNPKAWVNSFSPLVDSSPVKDQVYRSFLNIQGIKKSGVEYPNMYVAEQASGRISFKYLVKKSPVGISMEEIHTTPQDTFPTAQRIGNRIISLDSSGNLDRRELIESIKANGLINPSKIQMDVSKETVTVLDTGANFPNYFQIKVGSQVFEFQGFGQGFNPGSYSWLQGSTDGKLYVEFGNFRVTAVLP